VDVRYILRRLLLAIPVLVGVSVVVFAIVRLIPGDPAQVMLGEEYTPKAAAELRHKWGLDRSLVLQYGIFLQRLILHGDLGTSIAGGHPVLAEVLGRLNNTLYLAGAALVIGFTLGGLIGVLAGIRPHSAVDTLAMVVALIGVSMPVFWLGLLLIYLFAVRLGWFPAIGSGTWRHLVMPAVALSMFLVATVARQTRSSVLEVVRQHYVATAWAKGLSEAAVVRRHILKNALIPVVTVAGVLFGRTLGGSVITETVFAYPGMRRLLIEAILARDYPVVQGVILIFSVAFVFVNILVDILYCLLDPRITYA